MCTFNQVKLLFFIFHLHGRLHAVSIGKPEWMSNFWTVRFLKTESESNFSFLHIPNYDRIGCHARLAVWLSGNTLASINVVALRQTRLVLGWVTVCGRVNHLSM